MLNSKYNRKYDYQWAKYKDSKLIQAWFQCIRDTITKYNIYKDNICNFNEINCSLINAEKQH